MALGASWVIDKANSSRVLKKIKTVPNFSFINQNGQKFTNFNLKGNISIIDFMFTNCPGPCPIMANNMKELYDDHSKVHQVQFISITVDPKNDKLAVIKDRNQRILIGSEVLMFILLMIIFRPWQSHKNVIINRHEQVIFFVLGILGLIHTDWSLLIFDK